MEIVVIAESPAKRYEDKPAVVNGCRTGKVWSEWASKLGVPVDSCRYYNLYDRDGAVSPVPAHILHQERANRPPRIVIVLGSKASDYRKRKNINYYNYFIELPHPSGRNRVLNDKEFVDSVLTKAAAQIKSIMQGSANKKVWNYKYEVKDEANERTPLSFVQISS